jgi:S-formylglutathione hydrolase FrmB
MRKISILFFLCLSLTTLAQKSVILESQKLSSNIMGKEMAYSIYLPEDYKNSNRSYPVLYLLHGYSDDETGWTQFGEVQHIADQSIHSGEAPQMIIVMPDGGVTFYMNSQDEKEKYEDYFIKEFMPHIESNYRIRKKKEYRAVAGLSMGGFGSMLLATKNPDLFAAAAPLSGAFWTDDEVTSMADDRWNGRMASLFGGKGAKGKARLTDHWYKNSVLKIIETGQADKLKSLRYYIDCGDDDFLIKGNMALHATMLDKGIPHEFRVRDGGHTWSYWRSALPEVLKFVGTSFHR